MRNFLKFDTLKAHFFIDPRVNASLIYPKLVKKLKYHYIDETL